MEIHGKEFFREEVSVTECAVSLLGTKMAGVRISASGQIDEILTEFHFFRNFTCTTHRTFVQFLPHAHKTCFEKYKKLSGLCEKLFKRKINPKIHTKCTV